MRILESLFVLQQRRGDDAEGAVGDIPEDNGSESGSDSDSDDVSVFPNFFSFFVIIICT